MQADRALVLELFTRRRESYSARELLRVTSSSPDELQEWVAAGIIETRENGSFSWCDTAWIALHHRWTPRFVVQTLSSAGISTVPALNQLVTLKITLSAYQAELLRIAVLRERKTGRREIDWSDVIGDLIADSLLPIESGLDALKNALEDAAQWPVEESDAT